MAQTIEFALYAAFDYDCRASADKGTKNIDRMNRFVKTGDGLWNSDMPDLLIRAIKRLRGEMEFQKKMILAESAPSTIERRGIREKWMLVIRAMEEYSSEGAVGPELSRKLWVPGDPSPKSLGPRDPETSRRTPPASNNRELAWSLNKCVNQALGDAQVSVKDNHGHGIAAYELTNYLGASRVSIWLPASRQSLLPWPNVPRASTPTPA